MGSTDAGHWRNNGDGTSTWIDGNGQPQETKPNSAIINTHSRPTQPIPGEGQVPTPNTGQQTGQTGQTTNGFTVKRNDDGSIDIGGTLLGAAGDAASWLGGKAADVVNNPLQSTLAVLAGLQAAQAGAASDRANTHETNALKIANDNWTAGAPMRAKASAGLLTPTKVNLSSLFQSPNPFARRAAVPPATTPTTPVIPPRPHPPITPPDLPTVGHTFGHGTLPSTRPMFSMAPPTDGGAPGAPIAPSTTVLGDNQQPQGSNATQTPIVGPDGTPMPSSNNDYGFLRPSTRPLGGIA